VILFQFLKPTASERPSRTLPRAALAGIGLVGGVVNAITGGWGPVATPALMATRSLEPRKVVGSVNIAEFFVAVSASIAYLIALDPSGIDWRLVIALLVSGSLAAPVAAALIRWIPPRAAGLAVGVMIILTNAGVALAAVLR
jgi:uncharacterized protein